LSNRALVKNLIHLTLYAWNKVVSAVGAKPPHDGSSAPRVCARRGKAQRKQRLLALVIPPKRALAMRLDATLSTSEMVAPGTIAVGREVAKGL
jgi:hypothetical protein